MTHSKLNKREYTWLDRILWARVEGMVDEDGVAISHQLAKQAIISKIEEVVGEMEEPGRTFCPGMPSFQRDQLRSEILSNLRV